MNIGRKIFIFTIYQVQNIPCCYITFPFEPEIYCTVLWIGIIPEENQFTRRFLSQALENQQLLTGCIRNIPNTEFLLQIVEPQPTSKQAAALEAEVTAAVHAVVDVVHAVGAGVGVEVEVVVVRTGRAVVDRETGVVRHGRAAAGVAAATLVVTYVGSLRGLTAAAVVVGGTAMRGPAPAQALAPVERGVQQQRCAQGVRPLRALRATRRRARVDDRRRLSVHRVCKQNGLISQPDCGDITQQKRVRCKLRGSCARGGGTIILTVLLKSSKNQKIFCSLFYWLILHYSYL